MNDTRTRVTSGVTKFVYAVFFLVVIAIVVLIVGFLGGWFRAGGQRLPDGTYSAGVEFDSKEARQDIKETINAAENATKTLQAASDLTTVDGEVQSVDIADGVIVFNADGQSQTAHITAATEYDAAGVKLLKDIAAGDHLRLTMQERNGSWFVVKVTDKFE